MGTSFCHVGLVVSDLERSRKFYQDVLGLNVREHHPDTGRGVEIVFMGADASSLELLYYKDPAKRNLEGLGRLTHIAWYVKDMAATMARMRENGAEFRPGDPVSALDGRKIAFTAGPDGERIELVEPVKKQ